METLSSPSYVVIAYDATKERGQDELKVTVNRVRLRGDILRGGDTLLVLGVLHRVTHPLGYQAKACAANFGTSVRAMEEEVTKKADAYKNMLLQSAEACDDDGVSIEVKVTAGTPLKKVIVQEVLACKATWVILDRHLRRDQGFYLRQIPSKLALIQDSFGVEILRSKTTNETDALIEHKLFNSMSKSVPQPNTQPAENADQQSISSIKSYLQIHRSLDSDLMSSSIYDSREHYCPSDSGAHSEQEKSGPQLSSPSQRIKIPQHKNHLRKRSSGAPLLCATCGLRTELYIKDSMKFSFLEIQQATNDLSGDNLLGEGGFGRVFKGQLKDGQMIAAKVRKDASSQGFAEFHSEVYVLSFARHKNIVMLLGYCCKENLNILVYEYICNKSLHWHLFDSTTVLEWHQRHAIAIGTAKGLRFLHEECRGAPIIHRDVRPGNILLTHDFVPMLGDFGLARWKSTEDPVQTKILGTLGYVAPEYAENGIVSVRTDVYAFGIVLIQLLSGRKVFDTNREEEQPSLREWAEPLIEERALHELIDSRIEDSDYTYEIYVMAKTAGLCIKRNPEMRPSMGEVITL
ncbi:hypothetical protein Pint_08040 [Pistacia integerrima]|uniref:Uncharacterized protein n=1 Tax=Pistacia integerrima TaxID=434235 RepID=A0ACC0XUS5_9ROSI|nr:hypothetical protein Pint_08040 [Pistacia integerrima]